MTLHQLDLLAGISIVVCWCAFIATWLVAENHNVGRAPEERTRSWFGTAVTPALIIVVVINLAVPKAEWRSLTFYAPAVRILGLVVLLAATAFTIWARLALGTMWSGAPAVKQIVPFPVFLVLLEIKLHIEERLMRAEFPDDYPRYRQRVPQLVPGLKLLSRRQMAVG